MFSIECEKFYNLMQIYRHTPISDPSATLAAYHAVIKYIDEKAQEHASEQYSDGYSNGERYAQDSMY